MDQPELPFQAASTAAQSAAPPRRIFLGLDAPPLVAAADLLREEHGETMGDLIMALPGARAARRLLELLARRSGAAWTPPRVVTQGELIDELVLLERPVAGRLVRTLAWERALAGAEAGELARLVREPAGAARPRERLRLAETVRTLHGELAPEGRDFASLARGEARLELEEEAARWEVLARAQERYRRLLARLGLEDPHEGRFRAVAEGRVDRGRRVVLVGVADMNHLLARLLETIRAQVTVLVAASEAQADGFDELGRLRTSYWCERDVPLPLERWLVAEKPVDQANAVSAALAELGGRLAASEMTIGVADEEVVPYLERRMRAAGAVTRNAAGTPVERTRPVRLLRAAAHYLNRGGFGELAALARDPDLGPALFRGGDPAERLDRYHVEHLPRSGRGDWVEDPDRTPAVQAIHARIEERLGALATGDDRPAATWTAPIRDFLAAAYRTGLDPEVEAERVVAASLRILAQALGELEAVPPGLAAPALGAGEAIELLLFAVRGERVPPATRRPREQAVELLGWLDLALDDAAAVVLTGFNEGRVPRSIGGHAFLPNGVRRRLGLPSDEDRLARDVHAATVLLSTGREVTFITGRRSAAGDPLVPSRLAFHCPEEEIVARVERFLPEEEERRLPAGDEGQETRFACPRVEPLRVPDEMSVSSFRTFLGSPYLFFLQRVLRVKTVDDRARELDPLRFGQLAHDALEVFGKKGPHDSEDAREIKAFLRATVDDLVGQRFGASPLPAIVLQAEQLKRRLAAFARVQAERCRAGWRIEAVEWTPAELPVLEVDGQAMRINGRIDRIDVHADGRWAILDYKAGEKPGDPERAHRRRDGSWIDLQLPLYRLLAQGLGREGEPELGYCAIGKDEPGIRFVTVDWTEAVIESALDVARDVVRRVRAREFWNPGRTPYEEILKALWGEGMVLSNGDPEGEA